MSPLLLPCMDVKFLRECFDADFDAGILLWRYRPAHHFSSIKAAALWNGKFAGMPAGGPHKEGYMAVTLTQRGVRRVLLVHRILWCMWTGEWPTRSIDHRDMVKTNNSLGNLREASNSEQAANRRAMRSGLKGATLDVRTGRYLAQITHAGKNHFLGRFDTEAEAHVAYRNAAHRLHGEFARAA